MRACYDARVHEGRRRAYARGFTVIELMIVVVIVAVLAAIVIPAWNYEARLGRTDPEISAMFVQISTALEQFKIDSVKAARPDKDGVSKPDADAQRQISSVEFALRVARETLNEAISITTGF